MLNISTTANIFKIVLFFLFIFVFIKSPRTIMTKIKNTGCHNTSLHNENPCSIGARTLLLNEVSGVGRFLYKTQDILTYPHISGFTATYSRGFPPHSSLLFPAESCFPYQIVFMHLGTVTDSWGISPHSASELRRRAVPYM